MSPGATPAESDRAETLTERWREWLLLDGRRTHVTAVTVLALFAFVTSISLSGAAPLDNVQPLYYVFGGLISGNLTVITVVVSINQLLLSRELNTPSELRSQMEGVIDYRRSVADAAGRVAPVEPQAFLRLLFENTRSQVQRLGGLTITEADEETYEEIDRVVSELTERADTVDFLLRQSNTSMFNVLSVTLTTNYADEINRLWEIESRHGDSLPDDVSESIERIVESLQNIDIARQYFKSIYLQEELAVLSRNLFYVGLPSIAIVAIGLFLFTAKGGPSVPHPYLPVVVSAVITVGLAPITVLFPYILRVATVTKRTAAVTPFTTPGQDR